MPDEASPSAGLESSQADRSETDPTIASTCSESETPSQHAWLRRLVGSWVYDSRCAPDPSQPDAEPLTSSGTEQVSEFGGFWIVAENEGAAPGMGPVRARMTLGFDPAIGRFVGHWFCSTMPSQFMYEGDLDDDAGVLTLNTRGPSMEDPSREASYQDIIELIDDRTRVMRSQMRADDGSWVEIMRAEFRRSDS